MQVSLQQTLAAAVMGAVGTHWTIEHIGPAVEVGLTVAGALLAVDAVARREHIGSVLRSSADAAQALIAEVVATQEKHDVLPRATDSLLKSAQAVWSTGCDLCEALWSNAMFELRRAQVQSENKPTSDAAVLTEAPQQHRSHDEYIRQTVKDLREQARAQGLKISGTKAELVARLMEHTQQSAPTMTVTT